MPANIILLLKFLFALDIASILASNLSLCDNIAAIYKTGILTYIFFIRNVDELSFVFTVRKTNITILQLKRLS